MNYWTAHMVILVAVLLQLKGCESTGNASGLMTSLFTDYETSILPTCADNSIIQVKIGMALRQIIDLNEPKQILQSNVWLRLRWEDCNLKWNETETGIGTLRVPYGITWMPDITLYDNAENELGGLEDYLLEIRSNGAVSYNFPTVIKSLCKVDVTYFPFDEQSCKLTFGSWIFNGWEVNVTTLDSEGDMSAYVSNVEWEVTGVPAIRHEIVYSCCPQPFPDVTFYIQLVRKPQFYVLSLLFPCILISSMAILGFILPPESGEKVSMEITVLLSVAVFMLMVSETMPPTSETFPYIGIYFACALLLVSLSCLMTVVVLNLHFRGEHGARVPVCVRILFLEFIGRVLRVTNDSNKVNDIVKEKRLSEKKNSLNDKALQNNAKQSLQITDYEPPSKFVEILDRQLEELKNINERVAAERKEISVDEWMALARVVDRLCLLLFFLLQCCGMLTLMCGTAFRSK